MLLCAVSASVVSAQEGWKIKESRTDRFTDTKTIVEEHSDGRKRTGITKFFPATKIQQEEKVLLIDGAVTTETIKKWNKRGEQFLYEERHFDGYGVLREGKRWFQKILLDEQATVIGPKTEQEYDYGTKMWIITKRGNTSVKPDEVSKPETNSDGNRNHQEIFPIEWETGLDYFLHFNETAKQDFYNFKPITLRCSPNPEKQYPSWMVFGGPTEYHNWSVPCASAVHAGKITFESGGVITIQFVTYADPSKQPKLTSNTRNGITSVEHEDWTSARFRFVN